MKQGVPWSVKGVEPEAREAAKAKARRAGLTLGAWLNQVIRDSSGEELSPADMQRWANDDDDEVDTIGDLTGILTRIEALEVRQGDANREIEQALETLAVRIGRGDSAGGEANRALAERVAKAEAETLKRFEKLSREVGMLANRYSDIDARHEESRQEIIEALERLAKRPAPPAADTAVLGKLQASMAGLEKRMEAVSRDSRAAASTFEHALKAVMDRVVTGERRQQEQARTFERSLEGLAERIQEAVAREGNDEAEAIRALEHAVGEITEHFETVEKRRERASRAVEDAIKGLTQRLAESDQRTAEQVKAPLDALDRAVQRMTQRIEESDARAQGAITTLDGRVSEMTARVDRAENQDRSASKGLEGRLAEVVSHIKETDSRTRGAITSLDRRLADVASRFESGDTKAAGAIESLEGRLSDVVTQFRESDRRLQDTFASLDDRVSDVVERLDLGETETKASRLAMMQALDETRKRIETLESRPPPAPLFETRTPEISRANLWDSPESPRANLWDSDEERPSKARPAEAHSFDLGEPAVSPPEAEAPLFLDDEVAPGTTEPPAFDELVAEEAAAQEAQVEDAETTTSAPAAAGDDTPAEPPPYQTSEPVWALLAAARAAARAEQGRTAEYEPADDEPFELRPLRPAGGPQPQVQVPARKTVSDWRRSAAIAGGILLVAIAGISVWRFVGAPADGRPGFVRSLIDSIRQPSDKAAPTRVSQGAPAPSLPKPVVVDKHAATPTAPSNTTSARDNTPPPVERVGPLAKPDIASAPAETPPQTEAATPVETPEDLDAAKAIAEVRNALTEAEKEAAAAHVTTAAERGHADAQFTLARLYETGRGVTTDLAAARRWYSEAATRGHAAAAFNLGMLEAQSGTREGYTKAARWFDQAARRGLADAQFNLAMLYAQGLGIGRDPIEAFAWFSAAAAQGDAGAAAERDRIGSALDDASRARGEALARERAAQTAKAGINRG